MKSEQVIGRRGLSAVDLVTILAFVSQLYLSN